MIWYFCIAIFIALAALYVIGLVMGIFTFEYNEVTITTVEPDAVENVEEQPQSKEQLSRAS